MKAISLKLPTGLRAKLDRAAKQRRQSKSEIVRAALEHLLSDERPDQRPMSALELAGDLVGCAEGPSDLSMDPRHMPDTGHDSEGARGRWTARSARQFPRPIPRLGSFVARRNRSSSSGDSRL